MNDFSEIKDPVLREKDQTIMSNPSGDVSVELTEQDMEALAGAGWYADLSASLGCTLTKECQNCCN